MDEQVEHNVGQRIRQIRERQGLSLRALAARCALSTNAISLIERGENSPTVSSLHVLAKALNVPITHFFQREDVQTAVFVTPATRFRSDGNGIVMESLGIGLPHQQLEPFLISIDPGAGNADQPVSHAGEEFVYCVQGEVFYTVNGVGYQLQPGYSLLFDSSLPHFFENQGTVPARLIMIFGSNRSGQGAREIHLESS